ncbi:neural cell adhesion molecule 1-like [Tachypleus tridentatus]|uniref:neural cell adhesion molecule 1-like n=1 Tax=Tachypleus tridentatus TaxID=6853 RepID=UPI003FD0DC02
MAIQDEVAPTFVHKPKLRQEDDGNKLVFECQLVANPRPEVAWFREETKLIDDLRTLTKVTETGPNKYNISLELDDVIETDAGLYKVKAKNKQGAVSASINLNFTPADEPYDEQIDGIAPTYEKKPSIRQEDEGRKLLFECRILADPAPTVSWYHDGALVKDKGRFKIKLVKEKNSYYSALEIDYVTVEDAGNYKVTAKNELGESNATISLNFGSDEPPPPEGAKPMFTEKPVISQSSDLTKIIFECQLVADPSPTIKWYHNGKAIKDGGKFKYVLTSDKYNHSVVLEITKIAAKDGGEYKVIAKNKHGEGYATISLNFEGDGKPKIPLGKAPRFPQKPTIRQVGDNLILECVLEANPFPEITWYHGTRQISEGERHKCMKSNIAKDTYGLSLEIRDPTTEDAGNYRCNAVNELGESNANIALNFQGGEKREGPVFIEKPQVIPKDGGKRVILHCRVMSIPPPKTLWYHETKLVKETNRVTSQIVKETNDEFTIILEIRDPSSEDGGSYNCNIKNENGEINADFNLNVQELEKKKSEKKEERETETEAKKIKEKKEKKIKERKEEQVVEKELKTEEERMDSVELGSPEEKGLLDESGKIKMRPSEMVESKQKRKSSVDQRKQSIPEKPEPIDQPSTPLRPIPDDEEAPPSILDYQENNTAIEGQTGYLIFKVKGNPAPEFRFYKGVSEIFEGGRYKVVTDGDTNTVYFCIVKVKLTDEGRYKVVAYNKHGEDTVDMSLFVSGKP